MTEREGDNVMHLFSHGEELLEVLRRGRKFTESLLAENERLRFQVVKGESEKIGLQNKLESEMAANGWLHCPADLDLLFDPDLEQKYERALSKIGIDPSHLVSQAGHA